MKTVRGFTLLELLIVLAVAAVIMGVAVPSMAGMIRSSRLTAAHNEFLSSLYLLRSEAAKRNRTMKMCRTASVVPPQCATGSAGGWDQGWAIWADADNDDRIGTSEVLVSVRQALGRGVRLSGNGTLANRIAYRSTGAPAGFNNGTFTLCVEGGAAKKQIIISAAGRVRTKELRGAGDC